MKFIKIYQQNGSDFLLVNLANVDYVAVNKKSGTCKLFFTGKNSVSSFPPHTKAVLDQISEYNRQIIEYLTLEKISEEDF